MKFQINDKVYISRNKNGRPIKGEIEVVVIGTNIGDGGNRYNLGFADGSTAWFEEEVIREKSMFQRQRTNIRMKLVETKLKDIKIGKEFLFRCDDYWQSAFLHKDPDNEDGRVCWTKHGMLDNLNQLPDKLYIIK